MYQNQVQNKPTAAYVISLIAGIIGLIASLFVMFFLGILGLVEIAAIEYGYYDFTGLFIGYTIFGVWMLVSSVLVIKYARKLNSDPMNHSKYGKYLIILSILGVGSILGLVGGILALVYKPMPVGAVPQYAPQQGYAPPPQPVNYAPPPQQQYQQPMAHNCPQCGTMVQPGVRFCPSCGRQQY